jgi:hypothetical protein
MSFTITTTRREIQVQASTRKGAVHAAVSKLESGERVMSVRVA